MRKYNDFRVCEVINAAKVLPWRLGKESEGSGLEARR